MEHKSLRAVNLLFLIVLCLQTINYFLFWLPQYVRLILNQAFFVFLPAYLYLRLSRQPILEWVRWRWPGWKSALLAVLIGMGFYPLSIVSAGVFQNLLGLTFEGPVDAIPSSVGMAVLALIAYGVMAPFCEEFLFRGVIQPVYERISVRWGVLFVGFLFILFHLSIIQGLSIILLALALGFVYQRTRSLPASILTHFGANLLAALVITNGVFKTSLPTLLFSLPVIVGGLLLSLVSLVLLARLNRPPEAAPDSFAAPLSFKASWPLLAAALVFLGITGADLLAARGPRLVTNPLAVNHAVWQQDMSLHYEIRNIIDQPIGSGECRVTLSEGTIEATCQSTTGAYEVQYGGGTWIDSGGQRTRSIRWQAADGELLEGKTSLILRDGEYRMETGWQFQAEGALISHQENDQESQNFFLDRRVFPRVQGQGRLVVVIDYLLPFQLAGMDLHTGVSGEVARFVPYTWRQSSHDNGPLMDTLWVYATGEETLQLAGVSWRTRKVTVGDNQTIWYALEGFPIPVQFFNGMETWSLIE